VRPPRGSLPWALPIAS